MFIYEVRTEKNNCPINTVPFVGQTPMGIQQKYKHI
jgi:hypothetical protein